MNNIDIAKAEKGIRRYVYEDGIWEALSGVLIIIATLAWGAFQALYYYQRLPWLLLAVVLTIFTLRLMYKIYPILISLKSRYTYPRTGYANIYISPQRKILYKRISTVLPILGGIGGGLLSLEFGISALLLLIPASFFLLLGLNLFYKGFKLHILRLYLLALIAFLSCLTILSFFIWPNNGNTIVSFLAKWSFPSFGLLVGISFLVSGLAANWYYRRHNELSDQVQI